MSENHEILTIKEVAKYLRFEDVKAVYDLIHLGKLKATKLNNRTYRVRRVDLDRFLEENEVQVPHL